MPFEAHSREQHFESAGEESKFEVVGREPDPATERRYGSTPRRPRLPPVEKPGRDQQALWILWPFMQIDVVTAALRRV
jgi:hypothetical protein